MAAARRGRGEGTIHQRRDGTWQGMLRTGKDPQTGKRVRKSVYARSKTAVALELAKLQVKVDSGELPRDRPEPGTVSEFLERWLRDSVKPGVGASTYRWYEQTVRLYVTPEIGSLRLAKLGPLEVQQLYRKLRDAGTLPSKVRRVHVTLRRALGQAERWDLIPRNPCRRIDAPRHQAAAIEPLSIKEAQKLLAAAVGDPLEALYVLALTTGMREGEIFGLRWEDIDFASGTIQVRRAIQDLAGKLEVVEPKTRASLRRIDLAPNVTKALREHRKRGMVGKADASTYVFCDSSGGPLRRSNFLRRSFHPLLVKAGLAEPKPKPTKRKKGEMPTPEPKSKEAPTRRIRFHDLRHTTATLLLAGNAHPKVVQELLGHTRITTTLDTYSHSVPTMQRAAVRKLGGALTKRRDATSSQDR